MGVTFSEKEIEAVARVCHEANRAFCRSIGDASQPEWDDAPDWQRSSCVDGVKFRLLNPGAGPETSHENWSRVKLAEGWKYGPKKDPEKKEHHCLVPYDELPLEQRLKDHIFLGVVNAFMNGKDGTLRELDIVDPQAGASLDKVTVILPGGSVSFEKGVNAEHISTVLRSVRKVRRTEADGEFVHDGPSRTHIDIVVTGKEP